MWEEWRGGSDSWMGIGKNEMLFKKEKQAKLAHEWDDPESVSGFLSAGTPLSA